MITINSSEYTAAYLVHSELINKLYNETTEYDQKYKLKPQLFDYKTKTDQNKKTNESGSKANRKRSRNSTSFQSPETIELKQTCESLLLKLKESGKHFQYFKHEIAESMSRIWEEPIEFPQFHGINTRNDFQNFNLNNTEYLIPPHCRFFNHDLLKLEDISKNLEKYDFIVIDPPWRNKYIRRIKKAKKELGYKMLDNDLLSDIPLSSIIHGQSIVAIWCTNSRQHQQRMLEEFFPRWDLSLIHKITWLKLNTAGLLVGDINDEGKKQPYEVLFIAGHKETTQDFSEIKKLEFILSVPSVIHSHKPPIVDLFRSILPDKPKCLELFARYLQPGFTSIGLEVLKLMDARLYYQNKELSNL